MNLTKFIKVNQAGQAVDASGNVIDGNNPGDPVVLAMISGNAVKDVGLAVGQKLILNQGGGPSNNIYDIKTIAQEADLLEVLDGDPVYMQPSGVVQVGLAEQ